jgi:hypothetical protein
MVALNRAFFVVQRFSPRLNAAGEHSVDKGLVSSFGSSR